MYILSKKLACLREAHGFDGEGREATEGIKSEYQSCKEKGTGKQGGKTACPDFDSPMHSQLCCSFAHSPNKIKPPALKAGKEYHQVEL